MATRSKVTQRAVSRKAAAAGKKARSAAPRAARLPAVNPPIGNYDPFTGDRAAGRPCKICSNNLIAKRVLSRIAAGKSDQAIADEIPGVTKSSVNRHRRNHLHIDSTEVSRNQTRAQAAAQPATPSLDDLAAKLTAQLKRGPVSVDGMVPETWAAIEAAKAKGALFVVRGGKLHLDDTPMLGIARDAYAKRELITDKDGTFTFAIATDMHLCSKYERLDCLNDFYDQVQLRGITTVLNAGNWIDGEATFNRNDLLVHGMDAQLQYLAKHYPTRTGVSTLAIAGADHEGWYARREGVDIGRYAENVMRQNGREDWHDIGYMERSLPLNHYSSGEGSRIHIMHPGGGSAYAISYTPQKIIESFDGGDKPAALVLGHYHKADYLYTRNVHAMQGGCFQDQTVFMRQKRLSAAVGGCFVKITVDPRTGAFVECSYTFRNYFVKSYYDGRWSQHGAVNLAPRLFKP